MAGIVVAHLPRIFPGLRGLWEERKKAPSVRSPRPTHPTSGTGTRRPPEEDRMQTTRPPKLESGRSHDVIVVGSPGRRRSHRHAAGPPLHPNPPAGPRPTRRRHALHPRPPARRGGPAGQMGPAGRDRRRRHATGQAHDLPLRRRVRDDHHEGRPRCRRPLRPPPHAARPAAACAPPPTPAPTCTTAPA